MPYAIPPFNLASKGAREDNDSNLISTFKLEFKRILNSNLNKPYPNHQGIKKGATTNTWHGKTSCKIRICVNE